MVLLTANDRETYHRPTAPTHNPTRNNHPAMSASLKDPTLAPSRAGGGGGGGGSSISTTLSNFTSPPCFSVTWGNRKQLRCVKDADNDDGGIQAMREKLMLDFRRQAAQMQAAFFKKSDVAAPSAPNSPEVEPPPWNLRTRRAVCKSPNNNNNNNNGSPSSDRKPGLSPAKRHGGDTSGGACGGGGGGGDVYGPRVKFTRGLSKQEIEEDFMAMIGTRPVRRPKKRPKIVQRQIDAITPGNWLSEITADMYKVNEQA